MFKPKLNFGHPGFVAGRYYTSAGFVTNSTLLLVENTLYFQPFYAPERVAIDRLAFAITVGAGNAANEVRSGIYNTMNARPGNLLIDNGRTVVGTGTGNTAITCSIVLDPGWYWLALIANRATGSATQPTLRAWANEIRSPQGIEYLGASVPDASSVAGTLVSNAETVGTWATYTLPATATSAVTEAQVFPALWVRAA